MSELERVLANIKGAAESILNYCHTKTVFYESDDNPLSQMLKPPLGQATQKLA